MSSRDRAEPRRVDLYSTVHKGLRAFLADTQLAVGRADASDREEVDVALRQTRDLLELCRVHLDDENRFIHPAIEARARGAVHRSASDHAEHLASIERIEALVDGVEAAADPAEGLTRLYRTLVRFHAENLDHMDYEETALNAILWATHTDEELSVIEQAFVGSIEPATRGLFLRWMIPAMSHSERLELFEVLRGDASSDAFEAALDHARVGLSRQDWGRLTVALSLDSGRGPTPRPRPRARP